MTSRAAQRARTRELDARAAAAAPTPVRPRRTATSYDTRPSRLRVAAFLGVVAVVIAAGLYYAGNVFFASGSGGAAGGAIDLQVSMAGFTPNVVHAKRGETLTFNWWNTDGSMHLENGVHTFVSDSLGVHFELKAQSRETIQITAPMLPGRYDYWCDSCCGGKDNPEMHATIEVA